VATSQKPVTTQKTSPPVRRVPPPLDRLILSIVDVNKTVGQVSLQAGLYNVVRFNVTSAIVTYNGANYSAVVESGKLNVAIVSGGVRVTAGQSTPMLIDINGRVT
jgi:hypothetical protein